MDAQTCFHKKQERMKKRVVWGLEVPMELRWKGWELGKEISKNLVLKNLSLKTQKMKYRPPKTRFFFTVIPQPIFLSPGISFTLPIIFRPLEKIEYRDQLWFEKEEGVFTVDLRATLPQHTLVVPPYLQLPMCAVGDAVQGWFCLDNVGDLPSFYSWECPSPFQILPTAGLISPGQTCHMKVSCHPVMAIIYEVQATCWYGENSEQKSCIQLRTVAKCPQLLVGILQKLPEDQDEEGEQKVLHFGPVALGNTAERKIELYNPSLVSAPFRIEKVDHTLTEDQTFWCSPVQGTVRPGEKKHVSLFFCPETLDGRTRDYFSIIPSGSTSQTPLKVIGHCRGPAVSLQRPCVDFSWINLGARAEQCLWIENTSECTAYFQFAIDCQESVFSIQPAFGTLVGKARRVLRCTFQPAQPIIYFRRVACVVHHQDPLFLDLIGTCHSDSSKPAVLRPPHLTWYRTHLARGLTHYPPDILCAMLTEKKLEQDPDGALMLSMEDTPAPQYPSVPPMTEFFLDGTGDLTIFPPHVSIEPVHVDFGGCPGPQHPNPVPLCLTNHTKGKVTVVWTRRSDCPFWVTPESCEVPPLKSMAMRLHFQPPHPGGLFSVELEAFALYKVLLRYHNIEKDCTVCPSWCLKVQAQGHSYPAATEHHIPQYSLDAPKLFPAVSPGEPSYRSLLLANTGSLLFTFSVTPESSTHISLRPSSGLVAPGAHQIFLVCTYPMGQAWTHHEIFLQFNFYPEYVKEVTLQSREEPQQLQLDTSQAIYFRPTWVGNSSTSPFPLSNPSRLPLEFEWRVSQQHRKMLEVRPSRGVIQPYERLTLTWTFSPLEETKYLFREGMCVWEAGLPPGAKHPPTTHYLLRLVGVGVPTNLSAREKEVDFGNMLVSSRQSRELTILNEGNCALSYRLFLEQSSPPVSPGEPLALQMAPSEGSMPPRSQAVIHLSAHPELHCHYSWTISYALLSHRDNKVGEKQPLCHVSLTATYPFLSVPDICPLGSAEGITRKQLWQLFSLDTLNSYLERDPTPQELTYRVPTRHSTSQIPSVYTSLKLDFNFGAAPLEAPPSVVLLALKNKGLIALDWAFLFPSDQQIDLEVWAEHGEFSGTELHQMRAQDNGLFSVAPKAGALGPGQEQLVELKYSHLFVGTDRLPVLLKVSHGREVLLNFIGVTVKPEQPYVHFPTSSHQFVPVPIGKKLPPRQIYELYNGGSVPVTYEIQTNILSWVQEKNFGHPIFTCINPRGEIKPGTTARVLWVFSPIEAKTYKVNVPIHILGWNSALITFYGVGYDAHIMGETAPFHNITSWDNSCVHSRMMVPGQNVFLSQSHVSLGNIPVQSQCSRLLFLNNISKKETIVFVWTLRSLDFGELSVTPMSGKLAPGETMPFVVTLKTTAHSSFYSTELVCKVYQQEKLQQFHRDLRAWSAQKQRQEEEFIITDRTVKRRTCCAAKEPVRKYKTLPPIKHQLSPSQPAGWSLQIPKEQPLWPCPQAPQPSLLFLGLTARAHAVDSFLDNFSSFPRFFLHWELPKKKPPQEEAEASRKDPPDLGLPVSTQEKQLLTDCLCTIIRGLLEDKTFQDAIDRGLEEQVPYFSQFWDEDLIRFRAQRSSSRQISRAHRGSTGGGGGGQDREDQSLEQKEAGEEERAREEEETTEEEEEEEEEEEKEEAGEEDILGEKEEKLAWPEMLPSMGPEFLRSLKWEWQRKELQVALKEEKELREKEAIRRLPAFANLQEELMENMIRNVLVEASLGEVVLTSRPRVIALPPHNAPRLRSPDLQLLRAVQQDTPSSSLHL
ncbi:cilia- and flagella-associated protein 65 [Sorex araneus]|uniref:cilia- and flagella-associated protein 65 n=1 Tax=Sorex araneus TaxID=42254 RepID=UPI0024336FE5|nr:cilia- and flagella-associated protein 65 [Sorex araneus]